MQLAFRNRYNDKAITFVCGDQARECSSAFRDWAGALPKSLGQLARDGPTNEFDGNTKIGYNRLSIEAEYVATLKQIQTYSRALQFAVSGAATYQQA